MIVVPAVDLRGGACVQLVGGEYDAERVRLDDPVAVARQWAEMGFRQLHVVDLDAATGRGSNAAIVRAMLNDIQVDVQVGGGVRDLDMIERLLGDGARRVVVGTKAFEEPDWLEEMAERFPHEIMVAADVRDRRITTRGWTKTLAIDVLDAVEDFNVLPLAGVLVTAVHREGQMQGTDLPLMEDVAELSRAPVYASGGIGSLGDLRALADRGVAACVVGMALYTGALDPRQLVDEFAE
jgi:phosphoribosylformimino-5-aminoimidazole carboxamide ribotide isomerase